MLDLIGLVVSVFYIKHDKHRVIVHIEFERK